MKFETSKVNLNELGREDSQNDIVKITYITVPSQDLPNLKIN